MYRNLNLFIKLIDFKVLNSFSLTNKTSFLICLQCPNIHASTTNGNGVAVKKIENNKVLVKFCRNKTSSKIQFQKFNTNFLL